MYRIEIPVPQGKVVFGPRTIGDVGPDILAFKIAIGLVLPPNSERNRELLVSAQEAAYNSTFTSQIPQDNSSWFDCYEGTNIDIQRASTFDIRTKNAVTKFQIDNLFLIYYYYFETYAAKKILQSTAGEIISGSDVFEKYEKLIDFSYYEVPKLFDLEFGRMGEGTLAVMHGWRPGKVLAPKGYSHPDTFDDYYDVVSIIPEVFYQDFLTRNGPALYNGMINEGIIKSISQGSTKKRFYEFFRSASSYRNWIKVAELSQNIHEDFAYNDNDISRFEHDLKHVTFVFPKEQDTTSVLYAFAGFAATAIADLEESGISTMPYETATKDQKDSFKDFFRPDPFSTDTPFEPSEDTIGFYYKTRFKLDASSELPTATSEEILDLEERALQQVLDFYKKPKVWNFYLQGEELQKIKEHYFAFSDRITAPSHSGDLPQEKVEESRVISAPEFVELKLKIKTEEDEILRLQTELEPQINYNYPPAGPWQTPVPGDGPNPLPESVIIQRYKSYINDLISTKKQKIIEYEGRLEDVRNPSKAENYYVLATDVVLSQLESGSNYASSWRTIESGRVKPLIKFVEFITPTLRPGQPYRAYFEINKKKLDLIKFGSSPSTQTNTSSQSYELQSLEPCYTKTTQQELRSYEEYQLHAQKRRRELTRKLRTAFQEGGISESSGNIYSETPDINLGPFGPFDLKSAFSSIEGFNNVRSDMEYTQKALYTLKDKADSFLETAPWLSDLSMFNTDEEELRDLIDESNSNLHGGKGHKGSYWRTASNELMISLEMLKKRIESAGEDIQRSYEILQRENITLKPASAFDGPNEVSILNAFYEQIVSFLEQNLDADYFKRATDPKWFKDNQRVDRPLQLSDIDPKNVVIFFKFDKTAFNGMGPKNGKVITEINIGLDNIGTQTEVWSGNLVPKGNLDSYSAMSRPRTVNYVGSIVEMTSPFASGGYAFSISKVLSSYFEGVLTFCSELGLDGEKHAAISQIGTFTSGIKVRIPESESLGEGFVSWFDTYFKDPTKQWIDDSAENFRASDPRLGEFDAQRALKLLGKTCTIEQIYEEFADKFDVRMLLCNYLECMKIPAFSLTLPSFSLPPMPRIPILGIYWAMLKFFIKNLVQIFTRIICTLARTLIDKLAFPMCQEQLEDFIAAGSSATPALSSALANAFTRTGLYMDPNDKEEVEKVTSSAKDFFSDTAKMVTGSELCSLLDGRPLDAGAMTMVTTLAQNNGLSEQLSDEESVVNFFGVLGAYVPEQVCNQLSQVKTQLGASCDDEKDSLQAIRNRLINGEGLETEGADGTRKANLSADQVRAVMDIAEKNLQKQKETLQSLSKSTVSDLLPEDLKPGSKHKIVSQIPAELQKSLNMTMNGIFQSSRMAYLTSLSSYIPSIMIPTTDAPKPGEEGYLDTSYLRLEACLERIKNFTMAVEKSRFVDPNVNVDYDPDFVTAIKDTLVREVDLAEFSPRISPKELACLFQVYETEQIKLPAGKKTADGRDYHIVHKRFKPTRPTGLFKATYDEAGNSTGSKIVTLLDTLVRNKFPRVDERGNPSDLRGDLGLKEYTNKEFIRLSRPDPMDEDYQQMDFPDEMSLAINVPLNTNSPYSQKARSRAAGGSFRNFDRYYIRSFNTTPDAPKTSYDADFVLKPIRVNAFKNDRPFRFPLTPTGFGFVETRVLNSIAFRDTQEMAGQEALEAVVREKSITSAGLADQEHPRNRVEFPSIKFSDSVIKTLGASGYDFFESLTSLDFEPVATSEYPVLQRDLLDIRLQFDQWDIPDNSYRNVFDYPVLKPLSWWLPVDVPTFKADGIHVRERTYLAGGRVKQAENISSVGVEGDGGFYEFNADLWRTWKLTSEPKLHDAAWHMIKGAYNISNTVYESSPPEPLTRDGQRTWLNWTDQLSNYKAPISCNASRKGIHTRSPFFEDDFFISDKIDYFENSETDLYVDDNRFYKDYISTLSESSDMFKLKEEILEGLNSSLAKVMGANLSSTIIVDSPLNIEKLQSKNLIPNFIADFIENPQNYKGLDWPDKWGALKTEDYPYGGSSGGTETMPVSHYLYTNFGESNQESTLQGLRGPTRGGKAYNYFPNCCPPYGEAMSWITDYYHKEYAINSPKILEVMQSRLNELTGIILEELQNLQNQATEKLMPMIRKVMNNTLVKNSSRYGNVNYTCINPPGVLGINDYRSLEPADFLNIQFRAGPYKPALKMVEFATNDKTLDAYNIVIDQDRMLSQGLNPALDRGERYTHTETIESLNGIGTSTRQVFKFCETLPDEVVERNTEMFPMSSGKDFSRREAYSEIILGSLDKYFKHTTTQFEASRSTLKLGLKSLVFKSTTETILSNLLENLKHSSLFTNNYATRLGQRLSAKPYKVPGTNCLRNRFGIESGSLLRFSETLLKDAMTVVQSELTKPEFSPFKRSFNAPGPVNSAIKKVAFKMFVKVCLLDLMFKNGLSSAVWGLEPIISQPVFQKYAVEHVAQELDNSSKLKSGWGEIIEDLVGITNKRSSLEKFVIEMLMEFPKMSREVFNPGLGHLDFFDWQNYARVREFSEQTDLPLDQSKTQDNFYKNFGLFKRFPAGEAEDLKDVIYKDIFSNQNQDFANWSAASDLRVEFEKGQKALKFVKLKGYQPNDNTSELGYTVPEGYRKFDSFDLNKTRTSTAHPTDRDLRRHTAVNEFIIEDYVRVSGKILFPTSDVGDIDSNLIHDGSEPIFEQNTSEFADELEMQRRRDIQEGMERFRGQPGLGLLTDPRGWNEHGIVMSKSEFYSMMRRLWQGLYAKGKVEEYEDIISNSTFYQGTRLVQLFLKKVERPRAGHGVQSDMSTFLFEPELTNIFTDESAGNSNNPLSNVQFENELERSNRYDATEKVIKFVIESTGIKELSERERSFLYIADVEPSEVNRLADGEPSRGIQPLLMGVGIPIVSHEKPIDIGSCSEEIFSGNIDPNSPEYLNQKDNIGNLDLMLSDLSTTEEYKALMEYIFPLKRYMAISSISTTGLMAGYSDLPDLFESVKSLLSHTVNLSKQSPQEMMGSGMSDLILSSGVVDLADFSNKQGPNVPADPDDPDCFEFPSLTEDFWRNFYKEMKRLMKYTPSIILRGLANQMDPAYKEMRAHFLNCDLKEIGWGGVETYSGDTSTPVGVHYQDEPEGTRNGKYTPLFPTAGVDLFAGIYAIFREPSIMGRTIAKIVSYATTGMLPFIDLTTAFKVPCADINKAWKEGEKYDIGAYGRYGQPISPLTAMALSTYQLPADLEKRNSNCPDEAQGSPSTENSENDCDDVE